MSRSLILHWLRRTGVCAILDGGVAKPGGLLAMARRLRAGGVRVFQLRMKTASDRDILAVARALRRVIPGAALILNDRCDLARAAGADGVHLGQDDLPVADARRLLGRSRLVGISAGTPREVALAVRARPDYLSVGPAHATSTKRDAGHALGPRGVRRLLRGVPAALPRLAVGGITSDNAEGLLRAGIDAVAIASWWWSVRDPRRAAEAVCRSAGLHAARAA